MSEEEWLADTGMQFLLEHLHDRGTGERKWRLLGCACCRRAWDLLTDDRSRRAVEVCERFADGLTDRAALRAAHRDAEAAVGDNADLLSDDWTAFDAVRTNAEDSAYEAADLAADTLRNHVFAHRRDEEERVQIALLRDVFGNPFRPAIADLAWLTTTVVALAGQIYESRDFSALPVLADALQGAGTDGTDILQHCRDVNATHVRGCWVVDLALGRE